MSVWRSRCRALIAQLTADLPVDATLAQRRKALWGKGGPAHGCTSWGRKMWGREVRAYLGRHGDPLGAVDPARSFRFPEHVHFPFRDQAGA